jgi:hypothetical protein
VVAEGEVLLALPGCQKDWRVLRISGRAIQYSSTPTCRCYYLAATMPYSQT